MREQERGLLDAILADPDDDSLRRVYADWLDEHGEPERAEVIRLQLALANLGPERPVLRVETFNDYPYASKPHAHAYHPGPLPPGVVNGVLVDLVTLRGVPVGQGYRLQRATPQRFAGNTVGV